MAFVLRIGVVFCDVPLLISRTALSELGTIYDLRKGAVDLPELGVRNLAVEHTHAGHPALPLTQWGGGGGRQAPGRGLWGAPEGGAFDLRGGQR